MSFEIVVEKIQNNNSATFTIHGSKTLYEETFDGTHAGWHKFLSDITTECGLKPDSFTVEGQQQSGTWIHVEGPDQLDPLLDEAVKSHQLRVRVTVKDAKAAKKTKAVKATKTQQADIEKGQLETEEDKKHSKSACAVCCFPVKLLILLVLYVILFAFWIVGLAVALAIDIVWLPFKIICPLCCPCICCAEEISKTVFGLVLWVLKSPFRLAKKILS